jgi:cytochrome c-type biogenesis protein CcmH/NrfF
MKALDEPTLTARLGKLLDRQQIRSMLQRRDAMQKVIDALVAKHGDKIFF